MADGASADQAGDAALFARMSAAAEVLRSAGFEVEDLVRCPPAVGEHLHRALRWQRLAQGPLTAAHRACAVDMARGWLGLWVSAGGASAGGTPAPAADREPPILPVMLPARAALPAGSRHPALPSLSRQQAQLARVALSSEVRTVCAQLRAELGREAAELSLGRSSGFGERVRHEVVRTAAELDRAVTRRLAALGLPADPRGAWELPVEDSLPQRRNCRLEHRLTTVLGVGFGAGVSVTVGRVAAGLRPAWGPVAVTGCALLGMALICWVVAARRMLTERAAAERWVVDVCAHLRPIMEQRVVARMLAAELAGAEPAPSGKGSAQLTVRADPALTFNQE